VESFLGIEIGGTKLQIVAGTAQGKIVHRWRAIADRARGGAGICQQIAQGLSQMQKELAPRAIGVGFGGPIDSRTGRVATSHQVEGWEGFELRKWLAEQSGLPVATENDSNTAALAEATLGAGAGMNPVFYFNLGSGVGGGFVVDGRIYHGLPPGEAEFGHVRLDKSGATVESCCSGWALDRLIRQSMVEHSQSRLAQLIGHDPPGGEARHLSTALRENDPVAVQILSEVSDNLALALSHVIHLLHPEVLVLGGGVALLGEPLRAAVAEALPKYVMDVFLPAPPVRLATVAEDAVPAGALLLAAECAR
jgi:glucokinase